MHFSGTAELTECSGTNILDATDWFATNKPCDLGRMFPSLSTSFPSVKHTPALHASTGPLWETRHQIKPSLESDVPHHTPWLWGHLIHAPIFSGSFAKGR